MTTPGRRRKTLTERLRAIAGRSRTRDDDAPTRQTRITTASFTRSHRDRVWIPPDPPRRWFEKQGVEPMDIKPRRWF